MKNIMKMAGYCLQSLLVLSLVACNSGTNDLPEAGENSDATFKVVQSPLTLLVENEVANGQVFEPYRDRVGDFEPTKLLTFCHGHTEVAADFGYILQDIATQTGALVVAMDYRNAPGNENGDFNLLQGSQDTIAATRWALDNYPSIESSDLWGWSMGGFVSGMALAYAPELYRYWVGSFPAVNAGGAWALFTALDALGVTDGFAQEMENEVGCSFPECPQPYFERSPSMLGNLMHPERAVILHGVFDPESPYEQGREMFTSMVMNQIPASFYTFISEPADDGSPKPVGHGHGTAAAEESRRVVKRLMLGQEPVDQPVYEYVIDETLELDLQPIQLVGQ